MAKEGCIAFLLTLFLITPSWGSSEYLAKGLKSFSIGEYSDALESLRQVTGKKKNLSTAKYLIGMTLNRLQRYDEASAAFKRAIKLGSNAEDLYYEFGQSLYANNELKLARRAFRKSYQKKYKIPTSLYYVAHISQILEQHGVAKKAYNLLIQKVQGQDLNMQQIATFQKAESQLALEEERKEDEDISEWVKETILPQLDEATAIIPDAPITEDITSRKNALIKKFELDPNILKNGKRLPKRRLKLSVSQQSLYDSNVTLATDVPTVLASQKDSFIQYTTVNLGYTFSGWKRWIFNPRAKFRNTYHNDRANSSVFKNDAYNISFTQRNSYNYTLFGNQASFSMNYDFNFIRRDVFGIKEKVFATRYHQFSIGNKFKLFKLGNTGITYKYKDQDSYLDSTVTRTHTFSLDQLYITKSVKIWLFLFNADFIDNYLDPSQSTNSYLFRLDFIDPRIWPTYTLNLAMSMTILDTKEQSATRGTEMTLTPSIKLTKQVKPNLAVNLSYDYTKNSSDDETNFDYNKHTMGLELSYDF